MRTPVFWDRPPGLLAGLLAPAAAAYGAVAARRMARPGGRPGLPVICIGNFTVGGAGKTPLVIAVAALLRELGRSPVLLTRGYGGREGGPLLVQPVHRYPAIGDEALLLAHAAPTVVARDRPKGAELAKAAGADVIVLDDGLQNPSLAKDLTVAVFDGAAGLGNGRVLPAGPLRAPIGAQWPHVDAAVIVGPGEAGDRLFGQAGDVGVPACRARLEPDGPAAAALAGRRLLAFAGIGRPEKFFGTLRRLGAEVAATRAFPDHHAYTAPEVARLLDEAARLHALPVTTEKDRVRLEPLTSLEGRVASIATLPVRLVFDDPDAVRRLLDRTLRAYSDARGSGRPSRFRTASGET